MSRRRLIVNADDFGHSREVNEAVILAYRRGLLTSTSMMPSGEAFDHAVALAGENPGLAVGIHVTCVLGKSVLPHSEVPHIVDGDGNFPSDPALAGMKYFFCKRAQKELFTEIAAQFEKFASTGLVFSHVDSHCHMHVNPAVLRAAVELGERYGVRRIRVPEDDLFSAAPFVKSRFGTGGYALVFKLLAESMKRELRGRGFSFPVRVYGNFLSGAISKDYVLHLLKRLPVGVSEIYFHPALLSGDLRFGSREAQLLRELRILLDSDVRSKMEELEISPATYFDLDRI